MSKLVVARCDHPYCQEIVAEWMWTPGDDMHTQDLCEYHRGNY